MYGESFDQISDFFHKFPSFRYRKRETLLYPGDIPQVVYFIEKGFARLFDISAEGKDLTLVVYKPGEFFPVVWTFSGGARPNIYGFETLTPCSIRKIPRDEFIKFLSANPDVFMNVTRHIVSRFQVALLRMRHLAFGAAGSKLAAILLICSKEYGHDEGKSKKMVVDLPLTHRDLANLVGVTRETVSVEIKKLERQGIVGHKGHNIVILKMEKLEELAIP